MTATKTENLPPERVEQMVEAIFAGATVGDVAGLSQENLEAGYSLAFNLYCAGNFKDAETLFRGLCLYDYNDQRFWMGLAGCRQALGDYQGAIDAYGMATFSDALKSPAPTVYAGICCLKQGNRTDAVAMFKIAADMGEPHNQEHVAMRAKAKMLLESNRGAAS